MKMKVSEIMTLDVDTAAPDDTIQTAALMMADGGVGVLPVCDGERLVGMITDRDIAVRAVAEGKAPGECSVREVMTDDLNYAFEDDEVKSVAQKMGEWQVYRLPVLNSEKRLVGIVSLGDLALEGQDRKATARATQGIVQPTGKHEQ
jgi:CBS domain-containing protein